MRIQPLLLVPLVFGLACTGRDPALTQRPEQADSATGVSDAYGAAEVAARSGPTEATQPNVACPPAVGKPTRLFSDTVLIGPPIGVEFLPDDNPTLAMAAMSGGFVSACDATIKRTLVFVFDSDPAKSMKDYLREFDTMLQNSGYTGGSSRTLYDSTDDRRVAQQFPAAGGQPPTSLYVAARRLPGTASPPATAGDRVFIIVFETSPDDYGLLEPTFEESASSLAQVSP